MLKDKLKYVYIIIGILLVVLIVIVVVKKIHNNRPIKPDDGIGEVITIDEPKNDIPSDNDFRDNRGLFGSWNSVYTEVYKNNKLVSTYGDTNKFNLLIAKDDIIDICHIENDLVCSTIKYAYIKKILYLEYNFTYLKNESEVFFKDKYLVIKAYIGDSNDDYSLLYFEKTEVLS